MLPQDFKSLTRRVEDFLLEYKKASKGNVRVEKISGLVSIDGQHGTVGFDPVLVQEFSDDKASAGYQFVLAASAS